MSTTLEIETETGVSFSEARAEWVAAGRPSAGMLYPDRFMKADSKSGPIVPLVSFR